MRVLNFFAGPGAGKSTAAAGLFALMKAEGCKVELVTEYAKDLTYEGGWTALDNQLHLLGEQDRRLRRLRTHVDFVVTDSPLLLGLAYSRGQFAEPWFQSTVRGAFDCYHNVNFFVRAVKPYQSYGRRQSEDSARALDMTIRDLLTGRLVYELDGDDTAPGRALGVIRTL